MLKFTIIILRNRTQSNCHMPLLHMEHTHLISRCPSLNMIKQMFVIQDFIISISLKGNILMKDLCQYVPFFSFRNRINVFYLFILRFCLSVSIFFSVSFVNKRACTLLCFGFWGLYLLFLPVSQHWDGLYVSSKVGLCLLKGRATVCLL